MLWARFDPFITPFFSSPSYYFSVSTKPETSVNLSIDPARYPVKNRRKNNVPSQTRRQKYQTQKGWESRHFMWKKNTYNLTGFPGQFLCFVDDGEGWRRSKYLAACFVLLDECLSLLLGRPETRNWNRVCIYIIALPTKQAKNYSSNWAPYLLFDCKEQLHRGKSQRLLKYKNAKP